MERFDLRGRVALVTGGGRGLGRGMALALAEAGADVVVASRDAAQLDETVALASTHAGKPLAVPWDLADTARAAALVDEVLERTGRIDVLLHAAGNQVRKPVLELTAQEWDEVQAVHLRAAFLLSQAAARDMVARGEGGSLIYVASLTTTIGLINTGAYAAAKSGVLGLMRTLAVELAEHGVRANAVAPGYFHTALTAPIFEDEARRSWLMGRIPMGRPGEPDDLGGAAVFLASPASNYITGQVIPVDGGWLAS